MDLDPLDRAILVVLLAYHAESVIESVLGRIPAELLKDERWHFLCIDDASNGAVARRVRAWSDARGLRRMTVLHNPKNQGYGGIQKLAYRFAVDRGFALVILLPADGQYPPEELTAIADARDRTGADVILASRMLDASLAGRSGMPARMRFLNRAVTSLQNRLTGRRLSEYHTSYRAYAVGLLRRVPFEIATNEFHFDTELLLQSFHAGARVEEVPVLVRYDHGMRRTARWRYGIDVLAATLQYRMHLLGMFCSLKYRGIPRIIYEDKAAVMYSSHAAALACVREARPGTLLDIGCGPGFVAERAEQLGARVTGVDVEDPLPGKMSEFRRVDLDRGGLPVDPFAYDMVIMLDVIEHLTDPEHFLLDMRNTSASIETSRPVSRLVLSTPNVAFVGVRLNLLFGTFNYAERGILDIGHKRLFTRKSLVRLLRDCGYVIDEVVPIAVPFEAVFSGGAGRVLGLFARAGARIWPTMFAFQFLVRCHPLPGLRQLLRETVALDAPAENAAAQIL